MVASKGLFLAFPLSTPSSINTTWNLNHSTSSFSPRLRSLISLLLRALPSINGGSRLEMASYLKL
jgi:hypothetical protein